ncbi:MAG: hypothetical protein R8F63_03520 [Acidimicrobiales bacterium]|nr:hypothetical protein [Acidimicrobiales bacterium]
MATARVARAAARERGLPLVSVRSGRRADGFAEAGRAPFLIRVPLTQAEFDEVQTLRNRQRSALWGGVGCLALGAALARFPVVFPFALVIAALSAVMWGVCWLLLRRLLPRVEAGPGAQEFTLRGVHSAFADAVGKR